MRVLGPFALILLAAGVSAPAQAATCRVSLAAYRSLETGDTLASVVERLGCRGRKITEVGYSRQRRVNYSWRGRGRFGANVTLTFVNGRLTDKYELGLD